MDQQHYQWQRYLCPRGEDYQTDGHGFLLSSGRSALFAVNQHLILPQGLLQHHCAVVLGEAGIGKTTILQQIERIASENSESSGLLCVSVDLGGYESSAEWHSHLRENPKIVAWIGGESQLVLLLDSLDEGHFHTQTLMDALLRELDTLPVDRLKLILACRASEWQESDTKRLADQFKYSKLPVFNVTPLGRYEVRQAAVSNGIDPDHFIGEVTSRDIGPLAVHPITLKSLLRIYRDNKSLPADLDRYEVYRRSCLILCDEHDETRHRQAAAALRLDAQHALDVAAKIATTLVFCNRATIWLGADAGEKPTDAISFLELTTIPKQPVQPGSSSLTEKELYKVLQTGLFIAKGERLCGFAHQSYGEFLAAYYLEQQDISLKHLVGLFQAAGKITVTIQPQLQEVAAWLTIRAPQLRRVLIQCAPELVLRGDPSLFPDEEKATLTQALLTNAEQAEYAFSFRNRHLFRRLKCEALSEVLRSFLGTKRKDVPHAARVLALQIAEECQISSLCHELIPLALAGDEEFDLRFYAASAVADSCDDMTVLKLKQLAIGVEGDIDDNLKGVILERLWPGLIPTSEMFSLLSRPQRKSLTGRYRLFIYEIPERLKEEDIPIALQWVEQQEVAAHGVDKLVDLAGDILGVALQYINNPAIRSRVVRLVLARVEKLGAVFTRSSMYTRDRILNNLAANSSRRLLIRDLITVAMESDPDALWTLDFLIRENVLTGSDLPWLLAEWRESSDEPYRRVLVRLVFATWDISLQEHTILVSEAAAASAPFQAAVESYLAALSRARATSEIEQQRAGQALLPFGSPVERQIKINEFLQRTDLTSVKLWIAIDRLLAEAPRGDGSWTSRYFPPPQDSSVWPLLDDSLRDRVFETALAYVISAEPAHEEAEIAGFRALWLLFELQPSLLDQLSHSLWVKWIPSILKYPDVQLEQFWVAYRELLARAYQLAPDDVISIAQRLLVSGKSWNIDHWTRCVDVLWDSRIQENLEQELVDPQLPASLFENLAVQLIGHHSASASTRLTSYIEAPPGSVLDGEKIQASARVLLLHAPLAKWTPLLQRVNQDPEWGKELFLSVAYDLECDAAPRLALAPVAILRDLLMWLMEHFPESEDPQHDGGFSPAPRDEMATVRGLVFRQITAIGTQESYQAISEIAARFPEVEWTGQIVYEAEQKAMASEWKPLAPQQLLAQLMSIRNSASRAPQPHTQGWALAALGLAITLVAFYVGFLNDLIDLFGMLCETYPRLVPGCSIPERFRGFLLLVILLALVAAVSLAVEKSSEIKETVTGYSNCQIAHPDYAQRIPNWFRWSLVCLCGVIAVGILWLTLSYPW